jgi:hypothetical protein
MILLQRRKLILENIWKGRGKRAELALTRKYKTIKKAIEDDLFLFQDKIFKIEPLVGEIWPNS